MRENELKEPQGVAGSVLMMNIETSENKTVSSPCAKMYFNVIVCQPPKKQTNK